MFQFIGNSLGMSGLLWVVTLLGQLLLSLKDTLVYKKGEMCHPICDAQCTDLARQVLKVTMWDSVSTGCDFREVATLSALNMKL